MLEKEIFYCCEFLLNGIKKKGLHSQLREKQTFKSLNRGKIFYL